MTIAFAENACVNGVEFRFDTEVLNISRISSGTENWKIETTSGTYETKCIINAAGVYADLFS